MDQGPLVKEEIDAGTEFIREFDKFATVKTAFWLKQSDDDHRYLYLASDKITHALIRDAYGEAFRIATQLRSMYLNPFRVKLIVGDDALAQAVVDLSNRYPGRVINRLSGNSLGGINVDDIYIYPQAASVSA